MAIHGYFNGLFQLKLQLGNGGDIRMFECRLNPPLNIPTNSHAVEPLNRGYTKYWIQLASIFR